MHSTHKASAHYYSAGIFYDHLQVPRNRYLEAQRTLPPQCCSVKSLLYYIRLHGCMHKCCMHQSATERVTTSTEFSPNEMKLIVYQIDRLLIESISKLYIMVQKLMSLLKARADFKRTGPSGSVFWNGICFVLTKIIQRISQE